MTTELQFAPNWFSKPGDSLLSLMHRRKVSVDELAEKFKGGMAVVRGIMGGELQIDEGIAVVLADKVGGSTEFWIRRQANYDRALERAVQALSVEEAEEWLDHVPAPGSRPRGRLSPDRHKNELRRRLAFFNVSTLGAWRLRYGRQQSATRFRTSPSFSSDEGAVSMWLRQGELEAALVDTGPWRPDLLYKQLPKIRRLSRHSRPSRFLPHLKRLFADAGVALVVLRAPPGCRAIGASRLFAPGKAMVLLSFRHRADDQFWFTVLHECGHLLLHGADAFVDEDLTLDSDRELEANEFASSWIIPEARRSEFDRLTLERDTIIRFAVSIGVAPGIVVGQLQHQGKIGYERMNSLKRHWTWNEIFSVDS